MLQSKKVSYSHIPSQTYRPHLMWRMGHFPQDKDLELLTEFLIKKNAWIVRETLHTRHFRIPLNGESLHIKVHKKDYGVVIHAHIDLGFHGEVLYEEEAFDILYRIRNFLCDHQKKVFAIKQKI